MPAPCGVKDPSEKKTMSRGLTFEKWSNFREVWKNIRSEGWVEGSSRLQDDILRILFGLVRNVLRTAWIFKAGGEVEERMCLACEWES